MEQATNSGDIVRLRAMACVQGKSHEHDPFPFCLLIAADGDGKREQGKGWTQAGGIFMW